MKLAALLLTFTLAITAHAQGPLTTRLTEVLSRSSNGHSPTPDDITAAQTLDPVPDLTDINSASPLILKALDNPDTPVRTFALTTLIALQTAQTVAEGQAPLPPDTPAIYKAETARILTPAIPQIATHLTEESRQNRLLSAIILGGFTPNPPAATFPPLFTFLKREDAIGPVGQSVVADLLQLAPLSSETSAAIARYLRRADQTPDTRANLADTIASHANQSQSLNHALLAYLSADDPGLRARVILSLPQLELSPETFAETRARIFQIAEAAQDNLQVVNAAKSVAPCWTSIRMPSGCPVY